MTTLTALAKASTTNGQITRSELFRAYNRMRAIVRKSGDVKALERLNKALGILQSKDYYAAGEQALYAPSANSCGCKDWQYRTAKKRATLAPCKHVFAEMLVKMILAEREEYNISEWMHEARHALESSYRM